jgi:hypothetical protein
MERMGALRNLTALDETDDRYLREKITPEGGFL